MRRLPWLAVVLAGVWIALCQMGCEKNIHEARFHNGDSTGSLQLTSAQR